MTMNCEHSGAWRVEWWFRGIDSSPTDEQQVDETRFDIADKHDQSVLMLNSTFRRDAGTYRCNIIKKLSHRQMTPVSHTAQLTVIGMFGKILFDSVFNEFCTVAYNCEIWTIDQNNIGGCPELLSRGYCSEAIVRGDIVLGMKCPSGDIFLDPLKLFSSDADTCVCAFACTYLNSNWNNIHDLQLSGLIFFVISLNY